MRITAQPHHVTMHAKYKIECIDRQEEIDYHLSLRNKPPQTIHELSTVLGLLEHHPHTISKNVQHAKNILRRHHQIIISIFLQDDDEWNFDDDDDDWIFDPAIDAILDSYRKIATEKKCFPMMMNGCLTHP